MSEVTFDDLRKDPKHQWIIKEAEKKYGSPLPRPIKQLLVDITTSSVLRVDTTVDWIDRAFSIAKKIIGSNAHEAEYPLFWVYLYGIVIEFREYQERFRQISEQVGFMRPIHQSLDSIRRKLTEEGIKFIRFMRHSHVHIYLDYVWHQATAKNGKVTKVRPPYDPDAREIARRIIAQHDNNQQAAARSYAKKIVDDLSILREAAITARSG